MRKKVLCLVLASYNTGPLICYCFVCYQLNQPSFFILKKFSCRLCVNNLGKVVLLSFLQVSSVALQGCEKKNLLFQLLVSRVCPLPKNILENDCMGVLFLITYVCVRGKYQYISSGGDRHWPPSLNHPE